MIVSTGRSTLNPYIAVVIGLLALALYVSTTGENVPKLIAQAETKASQEISGPSPASTPPSSVAVAPPTATPTTSPFESSIPPSEPTANPFASPPRASPFEMPPVRQVTPEPTPASATPSPFGPQSGGQQEEEGWFGATPVAAADADNGNSRSGFLDSLGSEAAATAATVGATAAAAAEEVSIGGSIVWTLLSIVIGVVVFFGLLAMLSRLGGVDISAALQRGFNTSTALYDVTLSQPSAPAEAPVAPPQPAENMGSEVFQVGNGNLTYVEAKAACRAQGAKLATYSQIEDAYNNGAEWCSYGWSDGQLALFPTQKDTYEQLQSGCTGDQNACGRPGINGGFIANQNVRFAANCYGTKPKPTKAEKRALNAPAAISPQDSEANRLAQLFKQADKHFQVRPFAPGEWTEPGIAASSAPMPAPGVAPATA